MPLRVNLKMYPRDIPLFTQSLRIEIHLKIGLALCTQSYRFHISHVENIYELSQAESIRCNYVSQIGIYPKIYPNQI